MLQIVFLVILLASSMGGATSAALSPVTLEVVVMIEPQSEWNQNQILQMFTKTNKILSRCGIEIRADQNILHLPGPMAMGYESVPLANAIYATLQKPIVFLVNATQYNQSAGFAPGSRFLFVSSYSRSTEYQEKRQSSYEPLAHELGHMLGGLNHLAEPVGENLMSGYIGQQSDFLTADQCLQMRKHSAFSEQILSR